MRFMLHVISLLRKKQNTTKRTTYVSSARAHNGNGALTTVFWGSERTCLSWWRARYLSPPPSPLTLSSLIDGRKINQKKKKKRREKVKRDGGLKSHSAPPATMRSCCRCSRLLSLVRALPLLSLFFLSLAVVWGKPWRIKKLFLLSAAALDRRSPSSLNKRYETIEKSSQIWKWKRWSSVFLFLHFGQPE